MRTERIGTATLYLGDCLEVLPAIDGVDHVITDPPYGARTHGGQFQTRRGGDYKDSKWACFKGLGYEAITEKQAQALGAEFKEIASKWVCVMTSHDLLSAWGDGLGEYTFAPLPIVMKGMNVRLAGDGPSSWTVWMLVSRPTGYKDGTKPGAYIVSPGRGVERAKNPVKGHKPAPLMEQIVGDYSRSGDVVLDPFMGSGTTGIACANLGRKFIGIEIDPTYFDIACERIDRAQRQGRLFA